ncbi:MAG: hypothetical protein WAM60_01735, partial [Candidatus Promineifilaceae bacterium]
DGQILPTEAKATLTDAHTLIMNWEATTDDTATYLAGWSQSAVPNPEELTLYHGANSHSQAVGEAEVWYAHLLIIDSLGNVRNQTVGPVYVDGSRTPDLISNLAYQGWANDICTIEGVDRRLAQTHPGVAGDAVQRFYTSWDADAFRVSWHGANWNHEGDLFLYLDTRAGGSDRLFNPYPDDQDTVIYLPGNTPDPTTAENDNASKARDSIAGGPVMGADLVIWVENGSQATVYRWDGSAWQNKGSLDESNLHFVTKQGESWTDLLLPFSLMNIADPSTAALGLLAVATEEDALQIWSTMPTRNPINSPRVVNPLAAQEASSTFALVRGYFWNSLGDGVCANGRLNSDGSGPTGGSFADSDLQVTMSTDPVGTTYNFINDDMAWLWTSLFGFENVPIVPSLLFNHLDANHPPVAQGQTLTFVINYTNYGSETAENVQIDLNDQYSLKVAEQLINLGDIAPGASGSYTFTAQIDTTGLNPDQQQWAVLEAFVYDDQSPHSSSSAPLEWMWSDHKVDVAAPINVTINAPANIINDDPVIVRGNAYDESDISLINLEVRQNGGTTLIDCPDATPENASWQCGWEPGSIVDGDIFDLRAQAVDEHGHVSSWSDYVTVVVDTTPPTVTMNPGVHGQVFGLGVHTLSGSISDNLDVSKVRICRPGEDCVTRSVVLLSPDGQFHPEGTWTYYLPSPGTSDVNGLEQNLVVYGLDSVGNISTDPITVTYKLDFTTPELAVTNVVTQVPELSPIPVISGTVLDSSTFGVYLRVISPSGLEYQAIANVAGGTWDYTPFWSVSGEYSIWVYAEDAVGNRQLVGPNQITVIP